MSSGIFSFGDESSQYLVSMRVIARGYGMVEPPNLLNHKDWLLRESGR
jgi:hypothetical protein